ncbi:glycosyltransferase [Acetomicrobium sp.]|uniref:glycosyltransferase n=1 Tax=Acetomicrobium sp. TaxID=1872099 RepID=UPI002870B7F6|nr:glycosyltransferase [Acetomicrobium sp.]MDR9769533.1 glycosyltransferase [Acetomicrobium sp.]
MGKTISQWPIVYIILLNWNGWQDTIECLESLEKATYPNFNVVIIDNASANDSVARIRASIKERRIPLAEYKLESRKEQPVLFNNAEEPKRPVCEG